MSARERLAHLERWQSLLLLVLPAVWSGVVFSADYFPDPDAYFHVGVARRMIEEGWLRTFEWLPYSTLAETFPDMHFGQHVALVPIVAMLGVDVGLRIGTVVLASAFAFSLHLVLRRQGVRWAAPWVVFACLVVPLSVVYSVFLKGAMTFLIVLVWFVDAVWKRAHRRTAWLAALSVYVYVGAPILIPFVLVHTAVVRAWEGRWEWRPLAATVVGLVAAMVINPFWPAHWGHVAAELTSVFERDNELVPGFLRGGEWAVLASSQLLAYAGAPLIAWSILFVRQLGRTARVTVEGATTAVCAIGLFGASLIAGPKLLHLCVVFSAIGIPIVVTAMRPWPKWFVALAVAGGLVMGARTFTEIRALLSQPGPRARDYSAMARWLDDRTARGEVVIAAWDDFPGLFAFGSDTRYVAGVNVQFLRDQDRKRFDAYALLFQGVVSDPENLLPTFFDDARLIVIRREPRNPGELALTNRLTTNTHFQEVAGPAQVWRVFELKRESGNSND